MQKADLVLHAGYGSAKDVAVYQNLGLGASNMFVVGKHSRRLAKDAHIVSDGYAAHLSELSGYSVSRPAVGNARLFLWRGCFSLAGPAASSASKKTARKATSEGGNQQAQRSVSLNNSFRRQKTDICVSDAGNTVVEQGVSSVGVMLSHAAGARSNLHSGRHDSTSK